MTKGMWIFWSDTKKERGYTQKDILMPECYADGPMWFPVSYMESRLMQIELWEDMSNIHESLNFYPRGIKPIPTDFDSYK